MALLFREMRQGRVKVSLRSVGDVDVAAFAKPLRRRRPHQGRRAGAARARWPRSRRPCSRAAREYPRGERRRPPSAVDRLLGWASILPNRPSRNCRPGAHGHDRPHRADAGHAAAVHRLAPRPGRGRGLRRAATASLLLRLGGTCHGCSASTVTLKQGIEARLRRGGARGEGTWRPVVVAVTDSLEAAGRRGARRASRIRGSTTTCSRRA